MFNRQIIWKRAVFNSYGGHKPTYNWGASILLEQHLSWSRYTGKHREWSSHHRIGTPYSCHYISLLTVMWQSPKMGMFQLLTKAHIMIFLLPALIAKGKAFMFTSWINTQYVYIYVCWKTPLSCHSFPVRSLFMSSCFLFKSAKSSGFPRVYDWNHSTSPLDPYLCPLISC